LVFLLIAVSEEGSQEVCVRGVWHESGYGEPVVDAEGAGCVGKVMEIVNEVAQLDAKLMLSACIQGQVTKTCTLLPAPSCCDSADETDQQEQRRPPLHPIGVIRCCAVPQVNSPER
jgi:hypothetical protein